METKSTRQKYRWLIILLALFLIAVGLYAAYRKGVSDQKLTNALEQNEIAQELSEKIVDSILKSQKEKSEKDLQDIKIVVQMPKIEKQEVPTGMGELVEFINKE